ncbi:MAG: glycosyltransferase family 2 protein [Chloroflexota bacterium]|jgi:chlorobactene glucosyltransferase
MTFLFLTGLFVTLSLSIIMLTILANLPFFPRLRPGSQSDHAPLVSVLIPARNEAAVIGRTVRAFLEQRYPAFEIIVLDDNSEDETASIVQAIAAEDDRLHLIDGRPLPAGWLGKNWACHQLAEQAQGDYLLFTDADVLWQPEALAALVNLAQKEASDLLTVWPTQLTLSWSERLVVPLMGLAIVGYLPILLVHHSPWSAFAAANGQCLLFRRQAYQQIDGHAAIRDHIVEDVALARRLKAVGLRLRMARGAELVSCRMYGGWPEVRDGFAKNILAGHGHNIPFLITSTIFHWLVFIFPWLWAAAGGGLWPWLLLLAGIGARAVTARFTGQRIGDALLMPISVILMTIIAGRSLWWHWRGQVQWKGRVAAV